MQDYVLEVTNVCKKYDDFELKNINMSIPKGVVVGLIGENGAGKTTLIKSILNLVILDSGYIKAFGIDHIKNEEKVKKDIGVVLDDSFLSEQLNPNDINKIMKYMYSNWDEDAYYKYIDSFKLPRNKISKEYSSGMKMKLKIATALSHKPKFLILDEATSGLDPIARSEILDLIQKYIEENQASVLLSTHITSDLEHVADYIVFINNGKIVLNKSRSELLEKYAVVKCDEDEFGKISIDDCINFKKNKFYYLLLVEDKDKFVEKYNIGVVERASIEDIMLIIIRGEKK